MPLVKSNQIPCDCIPEHLGCVVLKSKYKIPKPIKNNAYDFLSVTTIDGLTQYSYNELVVGKNNKYKRTNKFKPYYTIINEYLYLIGVPNNDLKAVLIRGLFEDPSEADDITLCDENGNELDDTCFDPRRDTFQIDGHLQSPMIDMTLEKLKIPLTVTEDLTNNAQSVDRKKQV
jgi:hypothetical protein